MAAIARFLAADRLGARQLDEIKQVVYFPRNAAR